MVSPSQGEQDRPTVPGEGRGNTHDFSSKPSFGLSDCREGRVPCFSSRAPAPKPPKGPIQSLEIKNGDPLGCPSGFEWLVVYSMPSTDVPKEMKNPETLGMVWSSTRAMFFLLFCCFVRNFVSGTLFCQKHPFQGAGRTEGKCTEVMGAFSWSTIAGS